MTTTTAKPAANTRSFTPPHRRRPLETWWVRRSCPHWWLVLWFLVLGAAWPAASYVLTGWDCANPTHVTAYNKDKLCESGPQYPENYWTTSTKSCSMSRYEKPRAIAANWQFPSGPSAVGCGDTSRSPWSPLFSAPTKLILRPAET
jgi:hypothetical protein